MDTAYLGFHNIDVLDLSPDGKALWEEATAGYNTHIDRVETAITELLRSKLDAARTAHEMFRVFNQFNALLVRPRVQNSIRQFQSQLLKTVQADIAALQVRIVSAVGCCGFVCVCVCVCVWVLLRC